MRDKRDSKYFITFFRTFASILAKEGISVVLDNDLEAPGAFNCMTRVLYYRPLEAGQSEAEFGVICHEIGHALFTDIDKEFSEKYEWVFRIFNMIEDGYQERQLCLRYRSMRQYLKNAFDFFFESDEAKSAINENKSVAMTILNVLNYNCKGVKYGYRKKYPDEVRNNKAHMALLNEAEQLNDHDVYGRGEMAVKIRKMLDDYLTEEEKEAAEQTLGSGKGDKGGAGAGGDGGDGIFDGYGIKGSEGGELRKGDDNAARNYDIKTRNTMLDKIIDDYVYDHHDKIKLSKSDAADMGQLSNFINDNCCHVEKFDAKSNRVMSTRSKLVESTASRLYSQFMIRANAKNYRKRKTFTTGTLSSRKLHSHMWSDNLYKSKDIVDREQNHSYVFMLDVSGSMGGSVEPMFDKLAELKRFCEISGIDHEIWTYTTGYYSSGGSKKQSKTSHKTQNVTDGSNHFVDFSHVSPNVLHNIRSSHISMGGTNIMEAMMLGHGRLITKNTDKKVLVVLTDGEDNWGSIKDEVRVFGISKSCHSRVDATRHLCEVMKQINGHETIMMTYGFDQRGIDHMTKNYGLPVIDVPQFDLDDTSAAPNNVFIKQIAERMM